MGGNRLRKEGKSRLGLSPLVRGSRRGLI